MVPDLFYIYVSNLLVSRLFGVRKLSFWQGVRTALGAHCRQAFLTGRKLNKLGSAYPREGFILIQPPEEAEVQK